MIRLNVFVRVSETNREKAIEAAKKLTTCSLNFIKTSYNHQKKRLYLFWNQKATILDATLNFFLA